MQINDKVKESNDLLTEWGETIREINNELDKPVEKVNLDRLKELLEKKNKVWNKRGKALQELQTLIDKWTEDYNRKLDKLGEYYKHGR